MSRPFAIVAILLLVGSVAAVEKTKKEQVMQDNFEVTVWEDDYPEDFSGWMNYTVRIRCTNETPEGPYLFPYEGVEYALGVRTFVMGTTDVIDPIGYTSFTLTPDCYEEVHAKYFIPPGEPNITLVHLFKPEHSRLETRDYQTMVPRKSGSVITGGGSLGLGVWQMLVVGAGVVLGGLSLLALMFNRWLGFIGMFLALILIVVGLVAFNSGAASVPMNLTG